MRSKTLSKQKAKQSWNNDRVVLQIGSTIVSTISHSSGNGLDYDDALVVGKRLAEGWNNLLLDEPKKETMNEQTLRKGILDAYVHLRKTNTDIPSEVLDWIKDTCVNKVEQLKTRGSNRVVAAFCGTGKSFLCNKYPDTYKEVECWEYRDKQGEQFPNNYVREVVGLLEQGEYIVFTSTDPKILRALHKEGIEIELVYPYKNLRNEYLDRFIERESSYEFIGVLMRNWNAWITELEGQKFCTHKRLDKGQYLSSKY